MAGYCSTGQSPQRDVVLMEEEDEEEEEGTLNSQTDFQTIFSEPVATFYTAEIVLAVQFLHTNGIVHRYALSFFYMPVI